MSPVNSTETSKVILRSTSDFPAWDKSVKLSLRAISALRLAEGAELKPDFTPSDVALAAAYKPTLAEHKEIREWEARDDKAFVVLWESVDPLLRVSIESLVEGKTAATLYLIIKSKFSKGDTADIGPLLTTIFNTRLDEGEDPNPLLADL